MSFYYSGFELVDARSCSGEAIMQFLDHRDARVSTAYVGKDRISSFLSAENGGTADLSKVLESLSASDLAEMLDVVEQAEKDLIEQEDSVVDKILSSVMVRMNTVRAHDENIFWKLNKDWPKIWMSIFRKPSCN